MTKMLAAAILAVFTAASVSAQSNRQAAISGLEPGDGLFHSWTEPTFQMAFFHHDGKTETMLAGMSVTPLRVWRFRLLSPGIGFRGHNASCCDWENPDTGYVSFVPYLSVASVELIPIGKGWVTLSANVMYDSHWRQVAPSFGFGYAMGR